ncbi:MAG: nucleotidyltransferase family protein [Pyrinomonadaceae bacterium]
MCSKHKSTGELVAIALRGAWRETPPPLELCPEELHCIAPVLLRSGSAALVWWRASRTRFAPSHIPEEFLNAYKFQTLSAAVHERNVKKVFAALNAACVDAVLVKGWAIARRYPKPALRHYGDLDVCVRPGQFELATQVLRASAANVWVDLHRGFATLDHENEDSLFERASTVSADGIPVRVPSEEDHLRILCLHLLRHGAWRPLWLCDVALALESGKKDFEWARFFGHDARRKEWLSCVIGLARELVFARIDHDTADGRTERVPRWLVRNVLRRWSRWFNADYRDRGLRSLLHHRFEPARALEDLYFRFDPLRATVEMNGAFNRLPRLPYQLAAFVGRFPEIPAQVTNLLYASAGSATEK